MKFLHKLFLDWANRLKKTLQFFSLKYVYILHIKHLYLSAETDQTLTEVNKYVSLRTLTCPVYIFFQGLLERNCISYLHHSAQIGAWYVQSFFKKYFLVHSCVSLKAHSYHNQNIRIPKILGPQIISLGETTLWGLGWIEENVSIYKRIVAIPLQLTAIWKGDLGFLSSYIIKR